MSLRRPSRMPLQLPQHQANPAVDIHEGVPEASQWDTPPTSQRQANPAMNIHEVSLRRPSGLPLQLPQHQAKPAVIQSTKHQPKFPPPTKVQHVEQSVISRTETSTRRQRPSSPWPHRKLQSNPTPVQRLVLPLDSKGIKVASVLKDDLVHPVRRALGTLG